VITVTITRQALGAALAEQWPHVEVEHVEPLVGGQWATMARARLAGTAGDVPADVVVRVVPDPAMGAKELAVQAAAVSVGIRTPRVHLTGDVGGPLGGAWAVMDFVDGAPMLAGLDGAGAVRQFPALFRHLPRRLADTMASIHRVDPEPVARRVRAAAPGVAFTVDEVLAHLEAGAVAEPWLVGALGRLRAARPSQDGAVLCHGDLHPFNLLAGPGGDLTVLDWTAAAVAPPAYDVALTWLLLGHPPLAAPAALRPAIRGAGALLARRFVAGYRAANPGAPLDALGWYAGLHATRILVDLALWRAAGDSRAAAHPWRLVEPGARRALRRAGGETRTPMPFGTRT
jgi:aminoglycoside phosphotransferase (APT) family kinase protein